MKKTTIEDEETFKPCITGEEYMRMLNNMEEEDNIC